VEIVSLAVAIVVAVGGWVVNGVLERRSVRRDMRVTYLLSAYRALDGASNRAAISLQHERDLESAVADVVLLGSERQVELANNFSRAFAKEGHADSAALLEALRSDLRKELLLGAAGARTTWLRIESGMQWAAESARVRAAVATQTLGPRVADEERRSGDLVPAASIDPLHAIQVAYESVESALVSRHPELVISSQKDTLAAEVAERRLVSQASAQALEGLTIMRELAIGAPQRLSSGDVEEFVTLAKALAYAIRTER
jgi:hypothetical protein